MAKDNYRIEPPSPDDEGERRADAARPVDPEEIADAARREEAHPAPVADPADDVASQEEPKPCMQCGYDLRGLPHDARCPECGQPQQEKGRSPYFEPLSMMPMDVILRIRTATAIGFVAAFAAVFLVIVASLSSPETMLALLLIAACGWCVGVWLVTPSLEIREGIMRGFGEHSGLRRAARLLQLAWIPAAILLVLPEMLAAPGPPALNLLLLAMIACVGVGIAGIITLGLLLERLAEWTRDDLAERLFNGGEWGLGITSAIVMLAILSNALFPGSAAAVILRVVGIIIAGVMVLSIGVLLVAMASLARSASLSVVHAIEHQERMRRKQKRKQDEDRKMPTPAE